MKPNPNLPEDEWKPIVLDVKDILIDEEAINGPRGAAWDVRRGSRSRTEGPIHVYQIEDGRYLLVDGHHRIVEGLDRGQRKFKAVIVGRGYSDYYATPSSGKEFRNKLRRNPPTPGCLKIGRAYLACRDAADTATAKTWYRAYAGETDRLFRLIRLRVHFSPGDPYPSADDMREDVARTGSIVIYSGGSEHPLLSRGENLHGRAVHDLLAHLVCGCPFTATGEFNAFEAQAALYSVDIRPLLFSEIVAQSCAYLVQSGKHADQKVCFLGDRYEELAEPMRRQFKKGLGLRGVVDRGWIDPKVFEIAAETGYSLRYSYAILEEQSKAKVGALQKNPHAVNWGQNEAGVYAPKWAPFL